MSSDLSDVTTDDLLDRLSTPDTAEVGRVVAELITRHRKIVFRLAMRHCHGDAGLAEDVFQETFIRLFYWLRRKGRQPVLVNFPRLLSTFVKRAAIDLMRRELRHVSATDEDEMRRVASVGSAAESWEAEEDVGRLMKALPEKSRLILEMTMEGLVATEIADSLGISESYVRVLRHRALASIRDQVARDEENDGRV